MTARARRDTVPSRLRWLGAVAVVALVAAAFAILFRVLLGGALKLAFAQPDIVSAIQSVPWYARVLLPAVGGLLAGLTAKLVAVRGKSEGVGDVMEAVVLGRTPLSMSVTLLKSLGSWLAIATGGSIGREGPIIQFGGNAGDSVGRLLRLDDRRTRVLILAGTAAGFTAAYNTPLAAVLFSLEIVTGMFALEAVLPTIAAVALATALMRAALGEGPLYGHRAFEVASSWELLAHALLGLLAALVAQLFMRLLSDAEGWFSAWGPRQPWRAALGGLLVGLLLTQLPEVAGNGYEPLDALLDGRFALGMLLVLMVGKAVATTASVSSGSPGGVFTATLLIGAAFGACLWHGLSQLFGVGALGSTGGYALVGMAAMLAATTHAPLMAAVLVFEISGDYGIVVPLLLSTTMATLVSRGLRPESIYTAELRRRGLGWKLTLEGRTVER